MKEIRNGTSNQRLNGTWRVTCQKKKMLLYIFGISPVTSMPRGPNFIGTPLGFIAIRYRPALGRKVTYITDTVLETMYLFLNLSFTTKDNLLDIGILLSLLIPLGSLVMKISSFVEYTST